jgi:MOSC domain-containing protein YiiM
VTTAIFKEPAHGRVMARTLNLDGDGQADRAVHGGPHKAVCVYPFEHYAYWKRTLGRIDLAFGRFGENFTVEGMLEDAVGIGDVFRVGGALVQVTQPRSPCFKLGICMDLEAFPEMFRESRRTGYYLRVLEEGEVGAGDGIRRMTRDALGISVREAWDLAHAAPPDVEGMEEALRLPALSPEWRRKLEKRLA